MPLLFSLNTPLDKLEAMLLTDFAGMTLTKREIYMKHSIDRPYIDKNYRTALLNLEAAEKITADPPAKALAKPPNKGRRAGTFADQVSVTFPPGK